MKILVLPGDGIGPEITASTLQVLRAVDTKLALGLQFESMEVGLRALEMQGTTLPRAVLDGVPEADGVLLGPVSHYDYPPKNEGGFNPSAELRVRFNLFANIRPCRSHPELSILRKPMDMIIVRENTEGFYSDRSMHAGGEFMPDENSAFSIRKITAEGSARVARTAFELARNRWRKVTAVHKANVIKLSDGLFLREVRSVAKEYPDVELEELIVDAAAAKLIRQPEDFDVLVTTNMFGDILSDEATELCGSVGLGGSLNMGHELAMAQAQHGSAPDIAGEGIANPVSLILSSAMLLEWRGKIAGDSKLVEASTLIEEAVRTALENAATRTPDVGGALSTTQFTRELLTTIAETTPSSYAQ